MKQFSRAWKGSKDRAKQRKYRANAPKNVQIKFRTARLSDELAKTHGVKRAPVRVGDTVTIMRGSKAGESGEVAAIHAYKRERIVIQGFDVERRDGQKRPMSFHASNLLITELTEDDRRFSSSKSASKSQGASKKTAAKQKAAKKTKKTEKSAAPKAEKASETKKSGQESDTE